MFGSAKRLRERLEKEGRRAPAVVVRAEPTTETLGYPGGWSTDRKWKLTLKVSPPGEAEFHADVKDYFPTGSPPNEGSTMNVFFDANDHTKVCVEIASVVSAAPPAPTSEDAAALGAVSQEMKTWSVRNPPSVFKVAKMGSQLRAFQLAQARSGAMGTLFVNGQAVATGQAAAVAAGAGQPGTGAEPADPVERLAKLADLKERGALSEEEFETAKKQILGD
jgi:hypothetical protein